jgi:hypothetical protein
MEREYKNIAGAVKEISEAGEGLAIISTLNVVDSDGDVVLTGAFGEQIVQMIPTHDWHSAPIGKASIKESGDSALAEFKLNLKTHLGQEWYSALKFDLDNPPVKQEYSYGFSVIEESRGDFEGRNVRFLKKLKVHEISPVLVGAGVGTTTLALKEDKKPTKLEEDIALVRENIEKLIKRVREIKYLREKDNRSISKERIKELLDIEGLLMEMSELLAPPNNEQSKVIFEFHEIQKKLVDFRKTLL